MATAVASENATPPLNQNLAFVGFGAGILPLDVSGLPVLWQPGVDARIFLEGLARDMVLVRSLGFDRLYVASGVGGLASYDASQVPFQPDGAPWEPIGVEIQAFCLAAVDVNNGTTTERFVFVGTNDNVFDNLLLPPINGSEDGGTIYLLWHDRNTGAFVQRGSYDAREPVYALAASTELDGTGPSKLTLLAGTACASKDAGCPTCSGDVLRFDFDATLFTQGAGPIPFPTDPATNLAKYNDPATGLFVRDIVIHEPSWNAYVATYNNGILRFNVNGTHVLSQVLVADPPGPAEGWPALTDTSVHGHGIIRPRSLALSPSSQDPITGFPHLVVGLGRGFNSERQHWGLCGDVVPCDGSTGTEPQPGHFGIRVLSDITKAPSSGGPTLAGKYGTQTGESDVAVNGVSTRVATGSEYFIDAAGFTTGYVRFRYTPAQPPFVVSQGKYDDGLLNVSVDGIHLMQFPGATRLYAATERDVVLVGDVNNPTSQNDLATAPGPAQYAGETALWLSSFGPPDYWIFGAHDVGTGSTRPRGVRFFDVRGPNGNPVALPVPMDNQGSSNIGVFPIWAPVVTQQFGPQQKWMIVTNEMDDLSTALPGGPGLRVWDVRLILETPGSTHDPNSLKQLRVKYVEYESTPLPPGATFKNFGDVYARSHGTDSITIYVSYNPRSNAPTGLEETTAGIQIFSVQVDTSGATPAYTLIERGKFPVPGVTFLPGASYPLRMTFDAAENELYVALSCHGTAIYKFGSAHYPPTSIQWRPSNNLDNSAGRTVYQAGVTPSGKVYIFYLQGELEIYDRNDFTAPLAEPAVRYDMRRHPNQLLPDPFGPPGSYFIGNGVAGVGRIVLPF